MRRALPTLLAALAFLISPALAAAASAAPGAGVTAATRAFGAVLTEDFAFHRAIAAASGNPRFAELLEFLGRHVIPRQSIRISLSTAQEQGRYLARIQKEHGRIYQSIESGDAAEARKAMRAHLTRSLKRYRRLAERQLELR